MQTRYQAALHPDKAKTKTFSTSLHYPGRMAREFSPDTMQIYQKAVGVKNTGQATEKSRESALEIALS